MRGMRRSGDVVMTSVSWYAPGRPWYMIRSSPLSFGWRREGAELSLQP